MADEIGTKVSQLPLGENLVDSDLMYAVEGGISKKVEVGYLKNRLVGNVDSAPTQGSTNLVQSGGVYTALASKADSSAIPTDLADLADDSTHRTVTDAEKAAWDGKADTSDIPTALSDLTDDSTHRVVSDTEKATWNGKSDFSGSYNDLTDKPTIPTVEANPSGEATDELDKIQIGSTIYDIVGGGGGSEPIYGEASGSVANFADGSDNPLVDLKIQITASQGSGTPSPSNPLPISGWAGAEIHVADVEEPHVVDNVYNISWQTEAGEVFGGTLDVTTGVMTITWNSIDLSTLSWTKGASGENYNYFWAAPNPSKNYEDDADKFMCSHYNAVYKNRENLNNYEIGVYNTNNTTSRSRIAIRDDNYAEYTVSQFAEAMEGVKLVYQLQEPTTIQCTPTTIRSILGVNNVWADCGGINYLKYQRDLNACINDIIRRIEALENA